MQLKNTLSAILLVISIGSVATAQLVPGGPRPAPYPGGGGGIVPGPSHPGPGHPHHPRPRPPQPYPGNPYPSDPYYPTPPAPSYGDNTRTIYVGRNMVNETLRLSELTRGDLWGYEVTAVRVNTRLTNVVRLAQLLSDGRVVASQNNPGSYITLYPQYPLVLGSHTRDVALSLIGGAWVDTIEVELRYNGGGYNPNPNPVPQPGYGQNIDISVYRTVWGNDRIDLTQYTDLSRWRGYAIQQVIVQGTTRYGSSTVSLLINSFNQGQVLFNGSYSQQGTIWLSRPMVIGQGADSIVLYSTGEMTVERVTLVVR